MEQVSGFISFDGKLFTSSDACRAYEERVSRLSNFAQRCKTIVEGFASGSFLSEKGLRSASVPEELISHLSSIPGDALIDLWNEELMHLFIDRKGETQHDTIFSCLGALRRALDDSEGSSEAVDELFDFYVMKAETAYMLLAFVLEKQSPSTIWEQSDGKPA